MLILPLTLDSPAENIALDEALLEYADSQTSYPVEVLRLWEPRSTLVVLGRSSCADLEVDLNACRQRGVAVLRRSSGGASIVTGPGCLMYSVILGYGQKACPMTIEQAHRSVLGRILAALGDISPKVQRLGTSDLVWCDKKCSGNSLRCKRNALLYHGTLLYDFSLKNVGQLLRMPPRQPEYRKGRPHGEFVTNLPVSRSNIEHQLAEVWQADKPLDNWPRARTLELVKEKYSQPGWNLLNQTPFFSQSPLNAQQSHEGEEKGPIVPE